MNLNICDKYLLPSPHWELFQDRLQHLIHFSIISGKCPGQGTKVTNMKMKPQSLSSQSHLTFWEWRLRFRTLCFIPLHPSAVLSGPGVRMCPGSRTFSTRSLYGNLYADTQTVWLQEEWHQKTEKKQISKWEQWDRNKRQKLVRRKKQLEMERRDEVVKVSIRPAPGSPEMPSDDESYSSTFLHGEQPSSAEATWVHCNEGNFTGPLLCTQTLTCLSSLQPQRAWLKH